MNRLNKKLLILGKTNASRDIIKVAKEMGVYTIVTDDQSKGTVDSLADETHQISTTDFDGLLKLIKNEKVDGVFCGPSEFNLQNCMKICQMAGLPFYFNQHQWDICSNKASFKTLCRNFNVPCVPEYTIVGDIRTADLSHIVYPVMVKPVDGCSSRGITVCYNDKDLRRAYEYALQYSAAGQVLIEHYIQNDGVGLSVRYIISEGRYYLSLIGDRYVVDAGKSQLLISAAAFFPSQYTMLYLENIHENVVEMFKSISLEDGVLFMQALVEDGNIYFHEMGLRLSGGLIYKITEPLLGINDVKMMIRYALGGRICTEWEENKITPFLEGNYAGSLCIPLKTGTIASIQGIDKIQKIDGVSDFVQYYDVGDTVHEQDIGTLDQHFGRLKMIAKSKVQLRNMIQYVQSILKIVDEKGQDMIYKYFDPDIL